jgi:hypothetical protein
MTRSSGRRLVSPSAATISRSRAGLSSFPCACRDSSSPCRRCPWRETPTDAVTLAHDTSAHATPGYSEVTGVGTPVVAYLRSGPRRSGMA